MANNQRSNSGKKTTNKKSGKRPKKTIRGKGGKVYAIDIRRMVIVMVIAAVVIVAAVNILAGIFGKREKADPEKIAFAMVSCAENSTFDYTKTYSFIEDIGDGAGYTGGIIGFTTMTGDMAAVVKHYCAGAGKESELEKYIPALESVVGTDSKKGLGKGYVKAWKKAGKDPAMKKIQNKYRDNEYLVPAFRRAEKDGLSTLGKYIYYDTAVQHGPEGEGGSMMGIRALAVKKAKTPADGGREKDYLEAFLDIREKKLLGAFPDLDISRVDVQKKLVREEEFEMLLPLEFTMYGSDYTLEKDDLI